MSVPELDPQIIEVLRRLEESGSPAVETLPPEQARLNFARLAEEQFGEVDEMHSIEDADARGVPVRIYRPVESAGPSLGLVYFHGGGWVVGSIETHDGLARALARRAGCVVISVDYRLAPEHPYPAALEDCWTAARWVLESAGELRLDEERIGVGGGRVGGGLPTIGGG